MVNKVAAAGVSLILVVGVVIGVIVGVGHLNHKNDNGAAKEDNNGVAKEDSQLSTGSKAVDTICAPTDHKDACLRSLMPLAKNGTTDPKELVKGAIHAVAEEVQKAIDQTMALANDDATVKKNDTLKLALDNCKWYLKYAITDLEDSITMLSENEIHSMNEIAPELKSWLSAVVSLKQSCIDNIDHPEVITKMQNGLVNTTELTVNALAIIDGIAEILKTFNIPIDLTQVTDDITSNSRKLLASEDMVGNDGYPTWFSAADRKLLAVGRVKPDAIVAKDGSGQFKSISQAVAAYPKNNPKTAGYIIYVKAGVYNEYVTITESMHNVFMYGDGPMKTIVTGRKNKGLDGINTDMTATFSANGRHFVAKSMAFQNTAGPAGHQAVALRVNGDRSAFFDCRIEAFQDTLYAQTHRQFYRDCTISGTVDYIFGDSSAVFQNCKLVVRKPDDGQFNAITAHGRTEPRENTGFVIQNCDILAEPQLIPVKAKVQSYLGRPWKIYSRTVFMESNIGDFIDPAGWHNWAGNQGLDTLYYAEYANRGPGANTHMRVNWKGYHIITNKKEAIQFTIAPFMRGPRWLKNTGVPYFNGLAK